MKNKIGRSFIKRLTAALTALLLLLASVAGAYAEDIEPAVSASGVYLGNPEVYTVVFAVEEDAMAETVAEYIAPLGAALKEFPDAPAIEGREFLGWIDAGTGEAVSAPLSIEGDMRLVASYSSGEYPAQTFEYSDRWIRLVVDAPEGALPEGVKPALGYVTLDADQKAAVDAVAGKNAVISAVDISFTLNGKKVQPKIPVGMTVTLMQAPEGEVSVVHLPDQGGAELVATYTPSLDTGKKGAKGAKGATRSAPAGATFTFSANSFSVYVVVDDGDETDHARMTLNFWNGETKIATMYVKNSDDAEDLVTILYDPGLGDTQAPAGSVFKGWIMDKANYTLEDLDDTKDIADIRTWVLEQNIVEGMDEVNFYAVFYKTFSVTYVDGSVSLGNETINVTADTESASYVVNMSYTPESPTQNFEGWYVLNGNDNIVGHTDGTLYKNGDTITITGDVVFSVEAPEGHWLVFDENGSGATYNAPQFVRDGQVTDDSSLLTMTRYGYTFGGWYTDEACTDGNEFEFGHALTQNTTVYAKWTPNATAPYTILIWKQNVNGDGYDFAESVRIENGAVGTSINTVTQNGTGNDAYARINGSNYRYTGFHLDHYDQNVTIKPEGTSVLNVYYDRNMVTLNFYTFNATGYERNYDSSAQTGVVYYGRFNNSGLPSNQGSNYRQIYYYQGYGWIYENNGNYYYYNGNRYTRTGSWSLYTTTTGPFETLLAKNNFTWPTNYNWYDTQYAGGSAGGTRTTFLDAYLSSNPNDTVVNFYGQDVEGTIPINFYKQDPDNPNNYVLANTVNATAGTFYISDKYHGFEAYQYRVDGGQWQSVGSKAANGYYNGGEGVGFTSGLDIRFNRLTYPILYMDGVYVDGNNNPVEGVANRGTLHEVDDIVYGSNISSYNKGGANYYVPTYDGFVFDGWYIDDACTSPYTFTTMPEGITVYAKWRQVQYRVFFHPNADRDPTLTWGSDSQEMSFRVSNGGQVSLPTGTRTGYDMIGWFLDEGCTRAYPAGYVLNETNVTAEYDKTEDMTDPMDKFGEGATTNSDLDRPWITKKLDIYAKWRKVLDGADGIGVLYDPNGGRNEPDDTNLYLDQSTAITQYAPTAPAGKIFKHWVLQSWNEGTETFEDTDITVFPGETFTVKEEDAQKLPKAGGGNTYTVQLRAEYVDAGEETPTHIYFYANDRDEDGNRIENVTAAPGGNEPRDETTYANIQINEAVDILSIDQVLGGSTLYNSYTFLGWAKQRDGELWLTLNADGTTYTAVQDGQTYDSATQIAADEDDPIENLYAVWEPKSYKVKVVKITEADYVDEDFDFTAAFTSDAVSGGSFTLKGGLTAGQNNVYEFDAVPYASKFTITEDVPAEYDVEVEYDCVNADDSSKNESGVIVNNGSELTVHGDMTVTVTNTHKRADVTVTKAFSGIDALPTGFQITNDFDDSVFTVGSTGMMGSGTEADPYKWTVADVPVGTEVTFTESGFTDPNYSLSVNGTAITDQTQMTAAATAAEGETPANAAFTNAYTRDTVPVTLKKVVNGNLGNVNDEFTFTIGVYSDEGCTSPITVEGLTSPVTLKDFNKSGVLALGDFPAGAWVKIEETGSSGTTQYITATSTDGTTPEVHDGDTSNTVAKFQVPPKESDSTKVEVIFTNYANLTIPTGVSLDSLPYLMLLALALMGGLALLRRRYGAKRG